MFSWEVVKFRIIFWTIFFEDFYFECVIFQNYFPEFFKGFLLQLFILYSDSKCNFDSVCFSATKFAKLIDEKQKLTVNNILIIEL